jgi:hypothetical protein
LPDDDGLTDEQVETETRQAALDEWCKREAEWEIANTRIMRPGATGFRWFKSPNIVPIEQARCRRQQKD